MKRRVTPRMLGLLVAVGLLVYGAGGYLLVVSPKKSAAAELETEIAAANVELATARAAARPDGGDTQPIAVADIFRLAKAMPANPDMPGILLELSRIAQETGISFTSITPQASTAETGYQVFPI